MALKKLKSVRSLARSRTCVLWPSDYWCAHVIFYFLSVPSSSSFRISWSLIWQPTLLNFESNWIVSFRTIAGIFYWSRFFYTAGSLVSCWLKFRGVANWNRFVQLLLTTITSLPMFCNFQAFQFNPGTANNRPLPHRMSLIFYYAHWMAALNRVNCAIFSITRYSTSTFCAIVCLLQLP